VKAQLAELMEQLEEQRQARLEAEAQVVRAAGSVRRVQRDLDASRADSLALRSALEGSVGVDATAAVVDQSRLSRSEAALVSLRSALEAESRRRRKLTHVLEDLRGAIRVLVRVRPLLPADASQRIPDFMRGARVTPEPPSGIEVAVPGEEARKFDFFRVLDPEATQTAVFAEVESVVLGALDGFNAAVIAYGQSGAGKTHTVFGTQTDPGLLPRAVRSLFASLATTREFSLSVAGVELYNKQLTDTLAGLEASGSADTPDTPLSADADRRKTDRGTGPSISATADGACVRGLTWVPVHSASELLDAINSAVARRRVAATLLNEESSRSHAICYIKVRIVDQAGVPLESTLAFADLAGSERVDRSGSTGQRFKEAQAINSSLAALGDVVAALGKRTPHVPYRNSPLTLLLQPVLGGNAKTVLVANVTAAPQHASETLSTLTFASRVRTIRNAAVRNISF
jgi:hypothetical protein